MRCRVNVSPRSIPCRMCRAAPAEPCKYKGVAGPLGGHLPRTPKKYRHYHFKRVADARTTRHLLEGR